MTLPLHKKYNEKKSLEFIRNRYRGMKGMFSAQLAALQSDDNFLRRCETHYQEGYKDWHILSAILNYMIQMESESRKINLATASGQLASQKLSYELKDVVFSPDLFDGPTWKNAFDMHIMPCLITYGFEPRGSMVDLVALTKFLRDRMRHFEHDIPHPPMFGRPPAPWPKI